MVASFGKANNLPAFAPRGKAVRFAEQVVTHPLESEVSGSKSVKERVASPYPVLASAAPFHPATLQKASQAVAAPEPRPALHPLAGVLQLPKPMLPKTQAPRAACMQMTSCFPISKAEPAVTILTVCL
jgi:hypothetical protein